RFTLPTGLPLDGTADGPHTVHLRATDRAGNRTPGTTDLSFTLDTTPPVVDLTDAPASPTNRNVTVAGRVTDALSGVAALHAIVDTDSAAAADVAFDATGTFHFTT